MAVKKSEQRIKKEVYWKRLQMVVAKYQNALFISADNVSSKQISMIRFKLRQIDAYMIMGKNVSNVAYIYLITHIIDPHESRPYACQH